MTVSTATQWLKLNVLLVEYPLLQTVLQTTVPG
jgi:hypothetical protein